MKEQISLQDIQNMQPDELLHLYSYPITKTQAELLYLALLQKQTYGIFLNATCIGLIEIHNQNEIGYRIQENNRNKGYATIALKKFLQIRKGNYIAYVEKNNPASRKVLEKCNFHQTRELEKTLLYQYGEL